MSHFSRLHFRKSVTIGRRPRGGWNGGGGFVCLVAELDALIGQLAQDRASFRRGNVCLLESVPKLWKHQVALAAPAPDKLVDMRRSCLFIAALGQSASGPRHQTPPFARVAVTQITSPAFSSTQEPLHLVLCSAGAMYNARRVFLFPALR